MHECSQQFIHNCQKLERDALQQMVKQTLVYPYHGIQFSDKTEQILDIPSCLGESQENY